MSIIGSTNSVNWIYINSHSHETFFAQDHQVRLMNVKLISVFSLLKVRYLFVLLVFLQKFIALVNSLYTFLVNKKMYICMYWNTVMCQMEFASNWTQSK